MINAIIKRTPTLRFYFFAADVEADGSALGFFIDLAVLLSLNFSGVAEDLQAGLVGNKHHGRALD